MTDQAPQIDVSDMIPVHGVLRDTLRAAQDRVSAVDAQDTARRELIANYYDNVLSFLEVHHDGEEHIVFPRLVERCPDGEGAAVVEKLDSQHKEALDLLAVARSAVGTWQAGGGPSEQAAEADALAQLHGHLVLHLDEEEATALPFRGRQGVAQDRKSVV